MESVVVSGLRLPSCEPQRGCQVVEDLDRVPRDQGIWWRMWNARMGDSVKCISGVGRSGGPGRWTEWLWLGSWNRKMVEETAERRKDGAWRFDGRWKRWIVEMMNRKQNKTEDLACGKSMGKKNRTVEMVLDLRRGKMARENLLKPQKNRWRGCREEERRDSWRVVCGGNEEQGDGLRWRIGEQGSVEMKWEMAWRMGEREWTGRKPSSKTPPSESQNSSF